jgi:DNA repair exonuclease SbcCD nuclease subunit
VTSLKLLHAADLHLDSPLRGLDRYDGAPAERLRGASRRALERLVRLCAEEDVRVVLIAGDVYDGSWKDYKTGLFFAEQMARLKAAGTLVLVVSGNHDAESQIARHLRLPDNVHVFSTRKPETRLIEPLGLAVHGQGFATRAVTEDLATRYPSRVPDLLNIGLLHTCASGREGHESYAPCSVETMRAKGYDYWALGHVHKREVLCEEPLIVFPGNLQGRSAREHGAKGATLVTVDDARVARIAHVPLDVVRFALCEVDASDAASGHDVVDLSRAALADAQREAGDLCLCARVVLSGASRAHAALAADPARWTAEIRAAALDVGGDVWVEAVRVKTRGAVDREALRARDDAIGQLARALAGLRDDAGELEALLGAAGDLRQRLPPELREGEDAIDLDDPRFVRELLDDVEEMLLARLTSGEG